MDQQRAAAELQVIRQLMERPIRFSTMSGKSGILAGAAALGGLAASGWVWRNFHPLGRQLLLSGLIWAGVFLLSLGGAILLTWRRERSQGMAFWTPVKRRVLSAVLPPFLAAMALTAGVVILLWSDPIGSAGLWMVIAPCWMLFYGVALWQVGQFSVPPVRALGVAFLAGGLVAALLPPLMRDPVATLGVSFGGFHLVYGLLVWRRYGG